ncbi:type 1 fimbrial protein [Pseudomonas sp. NFXW11]|uniref:fimbrial protein n=1 Tax=Pseudomonas sp. NFXW11 TaxID=2819531 RepID=UPI003CEB52F1
MNFSKVAAAVAAVVLSGISAVGMAADQGGGKVSFKGNINDSPCSISSGSLEQVVEFDSISNSALKNGGKSALKPFSIKLSGCDLESLKSASVTFTGSPSAANPDLLGFQGGTAQGASLAIADRQGALIKLGTASAPQNLSDGESALNFTAYLQGDMLAPETEGGAATPATVVAGTFDAVANFTLAYQ